MTAKHLHEDETFLATVAALPEDFILVMLSENLNHARHVENERLSYCATATALFGITSAFISTQSSYTWMNLILCAVMVLFILLSICVNARWSTAFQRHLENGKKCYYMLHKTYFPDDDFIQANFPKEKEEFHLVDTPNLNLKHFPLYSFNIQNSKIRFKHPIKYPIYNKRKEKFQIKTIGEVEIPTRTHTYFKIYYGCLLFLSVFMFIFVAVEVLGGSGAEAAAACSCGPMFISYGGVLPPQL